MTWLLFFAAIAGWATVALLLCLGVCGTAALNDSWAPEFDTPEPTDADLESFMDDEHARWTAERYPDITEDTPIDVERWS